MEILKNKSKLILITILLMFSLKTIACQHTVRLRDLFTDGWTGGLVNVSVNGVTVLSNLTLVSGSGPLDFSFSANQGDVIRVFRISNGTFPNEMRVEVLNVSGTVVIANQLPSIAGVFGNGNCPTPMTIISSNVTQASTSDAIRCGVNQMILRLAIETSGIAAPINVTQIQTNFVGTAGVAAVSNVDIYFTGNSTTFSASNLFGWTNNTAPSLTTYNISGSKTLLPGFNYFFLVYDLNNSGAIGSSIDGIISQFTAGGIDYNTSTSPALTNPNPIGSRSLIICPPPTCTHRVCIYDLYTPENGWQGGQVTIYVDGVAVSVQTLLGATSSVNGVYYQPLLEFPITVSTGSVIRVVRTVDGADPQQMGVYVYRVTTPPGVFMSNLQTPFPEPPSLDIVDHNFQRVPPEYMVINNTTPLPGTATSGGVVGSGCCEPFPCAIALPVSFINFDANLTENKQVDLTWETLSERDNDYFTIEKSNDGVDWEYLDTVDGAGNTTILQSYHLKDENPNIGVNYYKLSQTDFNGQIKKLDIDFIYYVKDELFLGPNPTKSQTILYGKNLNEYSVEIVDNLGQNVDFSLNLFSDSKLEISTRNLTSGIYFVIVNNSYSSKILKLVIEN
jgi:hypothetical protein